MRKIIFVFCIICSIICKGQNIEAYVFNYTSNTTSYLINSEINIYLSAKEKCLIKDRYLYIVEDDNYADNKSNYFWLYNSPKSDIYEVATLKGLSNYTIKLFVTYNLNNIDYIDELVINKGTIGSYVYFENLSNNQFTTNIDNIKLNKKLIIYDLNGIKINTPISGKMYIINKRKVIFNPLKLNF